MIRTKTSLMSLSLLATAIMAASAQAAAAPSLVTQTFGTGATATRFSGGVSLNAGDTYVNSIPFGQAANVLVSYAPGTEVSQEADQYMVVNVEGSWYMRTPTGYAVWNTRVPDLQSYNTTIMNVSESVAIADLEAAMGINLDGKNVRVHVGFMTDTSPLVYSSAVEFAMATQASNDICPTGNSPLAASAPGGKPTCALFGTYTTDVNLTSNFDYVISGAVFVGEDNKNSATLSMDAGVKTYGESGLDFIVVSRGSKIRVNGTAANPVIMTSANDEEATATTRGQWGGLIINGNAPVNGCTAGTALCELSGEGSTGLYGGNNPHDSSGNLNYLQVKYAGFNITPDNELNGIAFQGVGDGTVVDYVQVHNNSDDGVEFFGGTVNAKHLYLSGNEDDSLDWTFGWKGKVQHVVIVQGADSGDQGIEADNNATNRDALPRSMPQLANFTMIGNANTDTGILLREGTGAKLSNFVVQGFGDDCIDIDHSATFINAGGSVGNLNGNLSMVNSRVNCAVNFREEADDNFIVQAWYEAQAGNSTGATGMSNYINSAVINALTPAVQTDSFFDQTDYIGAVKNTASDWTAGWTFKP